MSTLLLSGGPSPGWPWLRFLRGGPMMLWLVLAFAAWLLVPLVERLEAPRPVAASVVDPVLDTGGGAATWRAAWSPPPDAAPPDGYQWRVAVPSVAAPLELLCRGRVRGRYCWLPAASPAGGVARGGRVEVVVPRRAIAVLAAAAVRCHDPDRPLLEVRPLWGTAAGRLAAVTGEPLAPRRGCGAAPRPVRR